MRIVLLVEPKGQFPAGLSRICWRICLQQSISPKMTVVSILKQLPAPRAQQREMKMIYYAVFYTVAVVHMILECRCSYAPRGVANNPAWSSMEVLTLAEIINRVIAHKEIGPKDVVVRVVGLVTDAIYGVTTKDACDAELCKEIVQLALSPVVIKKVVDAIKGESVSPATSLDSNAQNVPEYQKYIRLFPTLKLVLPPFEVLGQGPDNVVEKLVQYAAQVFSDKISGEQI